MEFLSSHWGVIVTILFGVSELLAEIPALKANSVFQLLTGWLRSQKQ